MLLQQLLLCLSALLWPQSTAIHCLDSTNTLEDMIICFDSYTVPRNSYSDINAYNAAQANIHEKTAWNAIIASLLTVDSNCSSSLLPAALSGVYSVSLFREAGAGGRSFCVLSEVNSRDSHYARGWGLMVVPETRSAVSRYIHISAPHPTADLNTPKQAVVLFKNTGAKSLFVAGRHRDAFSVEKACVSETYSKTDPAHEVAEPFFDAYKMIRIWQIANGGCPTLSCAYLQMHGKGPTTCSEVDVFLSAGIGNSSWYTDILDSPVRRVKSWLEISFGPAWDISLPSDNSCVLTATQNVFGRLLNGVSEPSVCSSSSSTASGEFVHIEQNGAAREDSNYNRWTAALNAAFAPTCEAGMSVSPMTSLCVQGEIPHGSKIITPQTSVRPLFAFSV